MDAGSANLKKQQALAQHFRDKNVRDFRFRHIDRERRGV